MTATNAGLAEPPEGVITGDTIPRENEENDRQVAAIDEMVGVLKTRPAYRGTNESELREIIKEKYY